MSPKKLTVLKTIFFTAILMMGILSVVWSFEKRTEIDNMGIIDLSALDPETRQQVEKKIFGWGAEFVMGMVMVPLGGLPLLGLYLSEQYPRINHNRERDITYFQTQFGFFLLVIAVLISFSIDSVNDNREDWMYVWGTLVMIGVVALVVYRAKKMHEIFDSNHDIIK